MMESIEDDLEWEEWNPSKISFVNHMIAGSVAGLVEHVSIYPIDTIKTHIQYEKSASFKPLHSWRSALNLLKGDSGFFRLWRGVSAMFAGCIPAHSAYFAVFEASKTMLGADQDGHHPIQAAACGALAAISHDMFLTPFDVVKQRMQLGYYKNVIHCVRTILKTEGIGALYMSFPTTLMMNIPFGGVMVAVNESVKKILNPDGTYSFWTTMASGSIAGMVAAAVTNPLDVVKTRLQTQNLEHCTKSCEDPLFNPNPPEGVSPTNNTPSAVSPGSTASKGAIGSMGRSSVGAGRSATELPKARKYRRQKLSLPQGSVFSTNGMTSRKTNSSQAFPRESTSYRGLRPIVSELNGSRVPNMRMRALMTSATARQPLGSYYKSGGGMHFSITRQAVVRALKASSAQEVELARAASGGPGGPVSRVGMIQMSRQIMAEEGARGFLRGIVPRMMVHAPSVAISWTAYETMKSLLTGTEN